MNKILLIGRLTNEVKTGTSSMGKTSFARFTLAIARDRRFCAKDSEVTDFIPCIAFGKNAEFAANYLKKSLKVCVEGHWQSDSYIGQDGKTVYSNVCAVEKVEFVESKREPSADSHEASGISGEPDWSAIDSISDDELPFR